MSINLEHYKSINQTGANSESTSDRYSFIPTTRIIDDLASHGWVPSDVMEVNARKHEGFQKHLIRFRNSEITGKFAEECQPEIVVSNSHDGKASFCLMGGLIRFACANGLIMADSLIADHRIRHQGYTGEVVKEAVYNIIEDMPNVYGSVERFKDTIMTEGERVAFAKGSLNLIYNEEQLDKLLVDDTARRLAKPRRASDADDNLWSAFNIVQEKVTKGERFAVENVERETYYGKKYTTKRTRKTREIKSIDKSVKVNKALWAYAEAVADLKNVA